jgi:hypothetical protein
MCKRRGHILLIPARGGSSPWRASLSIRQTFAFEGISESLGIHAAAVEPASDRSTDFND